MAGCKSLPLGREASAPWEEGAARGKTLGVTRSRFLLPCDFSAFFRIFRNLVHSVILCLLTGKKPGKAGKRGAFGAATFAFGAASPASYVRFAFSSVLFSAHASFLARTDPLGGEKAT